MESGNATDLNLTVSLSPGDHFQNMSISGLPHGSLFVDGVEYTPAQASLGIPLNGTVFPTLQYKPAVFEHADFNATLSVTTADDYGRFDVAQVDLPFIITPVPGAVHYDFDSLNATSFTGNNTWAEFNITATPTPYEEVFEYRLEGISEASMRVQQFTPGQGWQNVNVTVDGTATMRSGHVRFSADVPQNIVVNLTACTQSTQKADQETCQHPSVGLSMSFFAPPPSTSMAASTSTTTTQPTTTSTVVSSSSQYQMFLAPNGEFFVDCYQFVISPGTPPTADCSLSGPIRAERICDCDFRRATNPNPQVQANDVPRCNIQPPCTQDEYRALHPGLYP